MSDTENVIIEQGSMVNEGLVAITKTRVHTAMETRSLFSLTEDVDVQNYIKAHSSELDSYTLGVLEHSNAIMDDVDLFPKFSTKCALRLGGSGEAYGVTIQTCTKVGNTKLGWHIREANFVLEKTDTLPTLTETEYSERYSEPFVYIVNFMVRHNASSLRCFVLLWRDSSLVNHLMVSFSPCYYVDSLLKSIPKYSVSPRAEYMLYGEFVKVEYNSYSDILLEGIALKDLDVQCGSVVIYRDTTGDLGLGKLLYNGYSDTIIFKWVPSALRYMDSAKDRLDGLTGETTDACKAMNKVNSSFIRYNDKYWGIGKSLGQSMDLSRGKYGVNLKFADNSLRDEAIPVLSKYYLEEDFNSGIRWGKEVCDFSKSNYFSPSTLGNALGLYRATLSVNRHLRSEVPEPDSYTLGDWAVTLDFKGEDNVTYTDRELQRVWDYRVKRLPKQLIALSDRARDNYLRDRYLIDKMLGVLGRVTWFCFIDDVMMFDLLLLLYETHYDSEFNTALENYYERSKEAKERGEIGSGVCFYNYFFAMIGRADHDLSAWRVNKFSAQSIVGTSITKVAQCLESGYYGCTDARDLLEKASKVVSSKVGALEYFNVAVEYSRTGDDTSRINDFVWHEELDE